MAVDDLMRGTVADPVWDGVDSEHDRMSDDGCPHHEPAGDVPMVEPEPEQLRAWIWRPGPCGL